MYESKVNLREAEKVGFQGRQNGVQKPRVVAKVSVHECLPLIDVHGDTAFADETGLVADVLQTSVENVCKLTSVVLPCAF